MDKMLIKEIRAVIFDVDNTLLATDKFVLTNIHNTVKRLLQAKIIVNEVSDSQIKQVQAKNHLFEDIFKDLFVGEHEGRQIWEVVLEEYRACADQLPYEATAGAIDVVQTLLKDGFVVGLVTNRTRLLTERLIQAGFNTDNFKFMCQPPAPEFAKPHPCAFEVALNELKKIGIPADQVIMVGDHNDDYYSAYYQNINFIAVLQGQSDRDNFLKIGIDNSLIIDDLNNLETAIKQSILITNYRRSLQNNSALDGRYGATTYQLKHYFSEYAFHKYRVKAEVEHLIALSEFFNGVVVRPLSGQEKVDLRQIADSFSWTEAYEVLQYDHLGRNGIGPVEHDTKAIELWLREKLDKSTVYDLIPSIHIFLTSEDARNIAHKLMLRAALNDIFMPAIYKVGDRLKKLSQQYLGYPVMGRTHFQPASPTTFGKIFAIYLARLTQSLERLFAVKLQVKINGAVGNYNSFMSAYPELDWINYSKYLAKQVNFSSFLWTDQRGPHNDVVRLFQSLQEIGNILRDLSADLSYYAGLGLMYFSKVESHVGSSVMPHKINPWFAEIAEGSLRRANALINGLSNDLDVSRLQRDLSDHEWERSYGEMFGYIYVAIDHLQIALDMLNVDTEYAKQELNNHPEIVTEALQTILRKHNIADAYNIFKTAFRGGKVTSDDLNNFINQIEISGEIKKELKNATDPKKYIGLAPELARSAINYYEDFKQLSVSPFVDVADQWK